MSAPALNLAERIEAEHQAARGAARVAIEHAIECGRLLIEAKESLPHGQWLPWLEAHTSVSARQSQRYMRLATAAIEGKCDATSFLTIEGALAAIAAPKDEPEPEAPAVPLDEYLAKPRPLEAGEIEIPVADVLFRRKLYPRISVRPDLIERYAEFLVDLPPIEVNQRHELIDGLHRLEAHKKAGAATIRAVVTAVADDTEHMCLAASRNAKHGEQLPIEQEHAARLNNGPSYPHQRPEEVWAEGARLAATARDCSGLKQAASEYVAGICKAVDLWRGSGVALRDLPEETRRDIKRWSRWARHREQYEALIFNELYDICFGDLDEPDGRARAAP